MRKEALFVEAANNLYGSKACNAADDYNLGSSGKIDKFYLLMKQCHIVPMLQKIMILLILRKKEQFSIICKKY